MQIILGVRNFGRIEYAEVDINGFSVFVGNNNSGKTYMMQLIYGFRKNLRKYAKDFQSSYLDWIHEGAENGAVVLNTNTVKNLEKYLNEVLEKKKEQIVLETFQEYISIEELYVKILLDKDEYIEYLLWNAGEKEGILKEIDQNLYVDSEHRQDIMENLNSLAVKKDSLTLFLLVNYHEAARKWTQGMSISISAEENHSFRKVMDDILGLISDNSNRMLFMPASRTGLLMLYKEFFAHKADETIHIMNLGDLHDNEAVNMGLTQPAYEFLRFIQTFQSDKRVVERNEELIHFIENHLIDGKICLNQGNQVLYQGKNIDHGIPLYLSSSMINELTPVLYALQSSLQKDYLIWDEIETSLHPQKQMELVRFLNRMSNWGMKLIVSTHSDTMATKINNLCMLSYSESLKSRQAELLKKAGLEPEDLLTDKIHIYQFTNDNNGKSHVSELIYNEFTGYEFTQFNDSVEQLFRETKLIME